MFWRLFHKLFFPQLLNVWYLMILAYDLSYADQRKVTLPKLSAIGVLGLGLGSIAAFITVVGVSLLRIAVETARMAYIFGRQGVMLGQQLLRLPQKKFQPPNLSQYQKILGMLGILVYLPGLLISLLMNTLVTLFLIYTIRNVVDSIGFFLNLTLFDLLTMPEVKPNNTLGTRNLFGLLGYPIGVICGVELALIIFTGRLIWESMYGLYLGLKSESLGHKNSSSFQDLLRTPAYLFGYLMMANIKVWSLLQIQMLAQHFPVKKFFTITPREMGFGIIGFIFGLPIQPISWSASLLLRILQQSYLSFKFVMQQILPVQRMVTHQNQMDRYLTGGLGLLMGGMAATMVILGSASIFTMYKWFKMLSQPRFSRQEKGLDKIKNLYGALNNLRAEFPAIENPPPLTPSGGKGSYCFIGKVLRLNAPSVAEIYLEALLQAERQGRPDLNQVYQFLLPRFQDNNHQKQDLDHAHRYVSRYLANP